MKDWVQGFDVEVIDNGLNDDPSKLYSYQNAGNMAGRVVPRRGFPASAYAASEGNRDINAR